MADFFRFIAFLCLNLEVVWPLLRKFLV